MSITPDMRDARNYLYAEEDAKEAAKNSVVYNPTKDDFSYNFSNLYSTKSGTSNASLGFNNNYFDTPLLTLPLLVNIPKYSSTGEPVVKDVSSKTNNLFDGPELYSPKSFDLEAKFKEMYGTLASKRDRRKFNKWANSEERWALQDAFEREEFAKLMASWDARQAALKDWEKNFSLNQTTQNTTPVLNNTPEPAVQPAFNEAYWLSRAKLFGFDSIDKVKEYLKKLGVTLDGMFGDKTKARHDWYQSMKNRGYIEISTPNGEFAFKDLLGNMYFNNGRVLDSNKVKTNYNYSDLGSAYNYKDNHGAYRYDTQFGRMYSDNTVYNPNTKQWGTFDNGKVTWKKKTPKFNLNNFAKTSGFPGHIEYRGGKKYFRYDPLGPGDYLVGEDGLVYDTDLKLPDAVYKNFYSAVQASRMQQGGKMNNQEEMQKAFMAFLILDAAEQGMQIQSEQDLQAYAELLGEDGLKAKYQEFIQKMLGLTPAAKYGAKLNYLKQLKGECPEGYEVTYFKEGGMFRKGCKICEAKKAMMEKGGDVKKKRNAVEEFKKGCKMKK